ncbi:hypothetical protein [Candidatus Binatus sp.]|uniref:hypothetical protein n=1 Tax=Candidatus Binatus sp. TaxID=2811406 RepID=UPI003C555F8C
MSLRHAAALALVGWYLMVPPAIPGTGQVDQSAPLSQWKIRRQFPHDQGCEATKARLREQALAAQTQNDAAEPRRGERNPEQRCILCNAQCVAQDDPRLKPN